MDALSPLVIAESPEMSAPSSSTNFEAKAKVAKQCHKPKPKKHQPTKKPCEMRSPASTCSNLKERRAASQHQSVAKRGEIQELVDYNSPELTFHEMHLCPFSKNHEVGEHFELISMGGKPLPNLVLCKQCKKVLVRYNRSTNSLRIHLERHEVKKIKTISKKSCSSKKYKITNEEDPEEISKSIRKAIDEIITKNSLNIEDA